MARPDNPVARSFGPPCRAVAILGGWALVGLSVLIGAEVVLRKVFNTSLQGADEIGGYLVAVVTAFGAGLALIDRAHTRIDLALERMPRGLRAVLNLGALAALAALALMLLWRGWAALAESIAYKLLSGTPLQTPLWVPQSVWAAGLAFFALVAVAATAHAAWLLVRDRTALDAWYGPKSLSEEQAEETDALTRRGGP